MAHVENLNKNGSSIVYAGFTPTLICSGAISDTKTVTFPTGFSAASEENLAFKVVFVNGHNALNPYDNMTLNGVAVVTNQQGTLAPIPIHEIAESGNTVYKVLGANVALDLYYTSDYDGNGTAAYVVAGNPLVLSSTDYSIYADGYIKQWRIAPVGTLSVTFSVPFQNTPCVLTESYNPFNGTGHTIVFNVTTTGFTLYDGQYGTGAAAIRSQAAWKAEGY